MTFSKIKKPRLIYDHAIPHVEALFTDYAELKQAASEDILTLSGQADALLVRSVTSIKAEDVINSSVKWIGSATIGTEHLEVSKLTHMGIKVVSAPGCNASAVVQYVLSALSFWAKKHSKKLSDFKLGIVGYGNIGRRIVEVCKVLGIAYEICDPPLAEKGQLADAITLDELIDCCDVVTIHTPLEKLGGYPTYHLFDSNRLEKLGTSKLLINAARGKIIEHKALKNWLVNLNGNAILDVWPNEPEIDLEELQRTLIATPHIAGYSKRGKLNATVMCFEQFVHHFYPDEFFSLQAKTNQIINQLSFCEPIKELNESSLQEVFLSSYNIEQESLRFKHAFKSGGAKALISMRNQYAFRSDFFEQYLETEDKGLIDVWSQIQKAIM